MKRYLSISQLNMLSRCGEQYRRRYILNEKIPPGISMVVGIAVDKSVTGNLGRKISKDPLLDPESLSDLAADSFNQTWDGTDVALNEEEMQLGLKAAKGNALDKTVRLAGLHGSDMAPQIEPTHLQRKVEVELQGYPYDLMGYIDIQEGAKSIRDTKTSGKTPAADIADRDDQLTIYAMMVKVTDGEIPEQLCLDYLVDLKTPKAKTYPTRRTAEDFRPVLARVEVASDALQKGVFVPARETDWWCDPRWCGYHSTCKYAKQRR